VCYLANQELPFWGNNESSMSVNKGNFEEFPSDLKNNDSLLENHLNAATVI
jgi:hypothetical protein